MHYNDIDYEMQLVVIDWRETTGQRPEHWAVEMDAWCGMTVTVADLDGDYVYLEEDEGEWSWNPEDFVPVKRLPQENPNVMFKVRKNQRLIEKFRADMKRREADKKHQKIEKRIKEKNRGLKIERFKRGYSDF